MATRNRQTMRFTRVSTSNDIGAIGRQARRWRQFAVVVALLAGACANDAGPAAREAQTNFIGGVVADEPRAALAGLAALQAGGTAADAAAATFFALAVTYPLAAGLAGGGTCVAFDAVTGTSESIAFMPGTGTLGGLVALPGAVRGMAALHARFGRLRWSQVILPAEEMARFGYPASRALASAAAEYARTTDRSDLGPFVRNGRAIGEGESVSLPALADTLSTLRTRGGGDLYFGSLSRDLVTGAQDVGGRLTVDDLKQYLPSWEPANRAAYGDLSFFTPASGTSGSDIAAAIWTMLTDQDRYLGTVAERRAHLLVEASARALADGATDSEDSSPFRAAALMSTFDPARHVAVDASSAPDLTPWVGAGRDGTTGLVTLDPAGSAVACVFTMNAPFGNGRLDQTMGIFYAPVLPPGPAGWLRGGADFMTPVVIANAVTGEFVLALTSTGGPSAPAVAVRTAVTAVLDVRALQEAVDQPRVVGLPRPDVVLFERGTDAATVRQLRELGHRPVDAGSFSVVSAILCFGGATLDPSSCAFAADGRGFGLADGGLEF